MFVRFWCCREEVEDEESDEDDGEEKGIQAAGVNGDADLDADEEERRAITYQVTLLFA